MAALRRLLALFRRDQLDRELNEEMLAHIELAERDALRRGLSPEEAKREARRTFGGVGQIQELHRDNRSARWVETFMRDFRYGLASLMRDRGFAFVAIAVLGLGIGANTAMFSLLDSTLLRPMPYANPDRIVRIWETPTPKSANQTTNAFFVEWQARSRAFEVMAASRPSRSNAVVGGEPVRLAGITATADYFNVFGVKAAVGRTFGAGDQGSGGSAVVVLSARAWQKYFESDPAILGRELVLDGQPYQVIGILPVGSFDREPTRGGQGELADFWMPLVFSPADLERGEHQNDVIARLRPGVTLEQANADMLAVRAGLDVPDFKKAWSVVVEPYDLRLVSSALRRTLYIAFGVVVSVLLITCANIANLLLARGMKRRREMAVRAALGAGRARLLTQLLTESLTLCLLGGGAGVAIAALLTAGLTPFLPADLPSYAEVSLNWRVLAFALASSLGAAVLVGLVPSLRASRATLTEAMGAGARGTTAGHERLRRLIVVAEVALSLVLVAGALLMFKSLANLKRAELGIHVDHALTFGVDLPLSTYPARERAVHFMDEAARRLQAIPGVEAVAMGQSLPLGSSGGEGLRVTGSDKRIVVRFKRVDQKYFSTLGIPLLAGRPISTGDRAGAPMAVVINETLAKELTSTYGFANPVGQVVNLPAIVYPARLGSPRADFHIVGVVRGERIEADLSLPFAAQPAVYVAIAQNPTQQIRMVMRTSGDPLAFASSVRAALREIDPQLPLADVRSIDQIRERSLAGASAPTQVIGAFAMLAMILAALGLYGVLAHSVTSRRREFALRIALGASSRQVLIDVARQAIVLTSIGLVLGLGAAALVTRAAKTLLVGVSALDPGAFAGAAALMLCIGVIASILPAARAAKVDPSAALRLED